MRLLAPRSRVLILIATLGGIASAALLLLWGSPSARADGTCTIYWTGATSTAWNTATNWSGSDGGTSAGRVPTATDVVCMSTNPVRSNVVYPSQSKTYVGLNFTNPSTSLEIQGGTLTINTNAGTINNLTFDGGTLAGSAPMSLTGALTFPAGGVTFTGATKTIASGATLSTTVPITVGGTAAGQNGALVNAGTVTLVGSSLSTATGPSGGTGSTFSNSGSLTLRNGAQLPVVGNGPKAPAVTNAGTLTVSGTTAGDVAAPFTNTGTVTTTSTGLYVDSGNVPGTTDTGIWVTGSDPGTAVVFDGGARSVTAGSVTGGAGITITSGTTTFTSGVTVSTLGLQGGSVKGSLVVSTAVLTSGTLTGTGTMTLTGSGSQLCSVTIDNGYTLQNTGTATIKPGTCGAPNLTNGGHVVNTGTLTITYPTTNSGVTAFGSDNTAANSVLNDTGGTLNATIGTGSYALINPKFTNRGTVNVTSGILDLTAGNIAGTTDTGTATLATGASLELDGGARTIAATTVTGAGTLVLYGSNVAFTGSPTITTLELDAGTVTGDVSVTTGVLKAGTVTGTGTMTLTGSGSQLCNVTIDNGYTVQNTGTATVKPATCGAPNLTNGGHVVNTGTLTITYPTTNTGVTAFGSDNTAANSVLNDTGGTLNATIGTGSYALINPKFTNNGTVSATRGTLRLTTVTNLSGTGVLIGGTWNATGGTLNLPAAITTNAATLVVGAGGAVTASGNALTGLTTNTGSLTITPSLTITTALTNSGTVTVAGNTLQVAKYTQTAGTTTVAGGATLKAGSTGSAAVLLNGGTLTGSGTVLGAVSGAATVAPGSGGSGTLSITGSYAASAGSTFAPTVGATTGTATVSGAVTLNGTLALATTAPLPAVGTAVTVLNGTSRSGTFTAVTGQDVPGSGAYWAVSYTATGVVVTLTADPTVSVGNVSVAEGNSDTSPATFTLSLSSPSQIPVTVAYATADGTATAGSDYTAASGSVTFPVGTTSQTVAVSITGDAVYENDETFTLTLAAPSGATLGTATATGTIVNDDAAPAVSIGSAGGSIDKNLGTTITFPVSLSAASALDTQVLYATSDGTATAPGDYTATSGTLVIPAGSTSGQIQVAVPTQAGAAPPKTFTVTLSAPVNATLGTATATGTITNTNTAGGTPSVTSVSPNLGAQGVIVNVAIAGANLEPGSTLAVSGTGVTVSNVVVGNSAQVTARFTIAGTATPGPRDVTVTGPTVGAATCGGCFTVTPKPTVSAPSVTAFAQGNVDVVFTASGSNFGPGTTLSLVKSSTTITASSVTVNSASSLTAVVSVSISAATGAYDVVVANPDGGKGSCTGCVKVVAAPKLKAVSPSALTRGTATAVTVTGSGFAAGAVLSIQDCTLSNVVVVNATTITATVTPKAGAATGSKNVKVFNPVTAGSGTAAAKLATVS